MQILVIEDNPREARRIGDALGQVPALAAEVLHVGRLNDAIASLASEPQPDLILLDLELPDAGGWEALTQVVRVAPTLPIVVVTGHDDREAAFQAVRRGAQDCLSKNELEAGTLARAIWYAVKRKNMQGRDHLLAEVGSLLALPLTATEASGPSREVAVGSPAPHSVVNGFETTLLTAAELALGHLRSWCIVDVVDADGSMRRVGIVHPDPDKRESIQRLQGGWQPRRDDPLGVPRAILAGATEVIPRVSEEVLVEAAHGEDNLRDLRTLGFGPVAVVPLVARGDVLGAFTFVRLVAGQPFTKPDVMLAEELATRCAIAFDNARLLEGTTIARQEAEQARSRAAHLTGQLVIAGLHQQELAEEAQDASQAKSQFLATMSHEIRTPINAIVGYAYLLEMEEVGGALTPKQRTYVARLKDSSRHLIGLIDDILDLAKVESGRMLVKQETGLAQESIASAMAMIEPQALSAGVDVRTELPDANSFYAGDRDRVRQILVILLSNALKFTDRGGSITLSCGTVRTPDVEARLAYGGPWTFLRVLDTGIGISASQAKTVFDAFVQADPGYARKQGGAGLGLAIGLEVARLMNGDLTLRSFMSEGACFTLWLPSVAPPEDRAVGGAHDSVRGRVALPAGS